MTTPTVQDKVCLVTGGTSGIGQATVLALAQQGARVLFTGRDAARGTEVLATLKSSPGAHAAEAEFLQADFSTQTAVRHLADEVLARCPKLHVLVNNAGTVYAERILTPDGIERTFAANHLAPFLLTNLLRAPLVAAASIDGYARVVTVSSGAHQMGRMDFDDLNFERRRYKPFAAYGDSKLANILFTTELARRWQGDGVTANCLHPGVVRTNIWNSSRGFTRLLTTLAQVFMISPERGAQTMVYLATSPEVASTSGKYFVKCREAATSSAARDPSLAAQLWETSSRLTGFTPPDGRTA